MGATRWIADHSAVVAQALTPWSCCWNAKPSTWSLKPPRCTTYSRLPPNSRLRPPLASGPKVATTYEHRSSVRRDNGKLVHDGPHVATPEEDGNTVTLTLEAGTTYTLDSGAHRSAPAYVGEQGAACQTEQRAPTQREPSRILCALTRRLLGIVCGGNNDCSG